MQKSRLDRQYMQFISMKDVTNILCVGCVTHTTAGKECIANMITNLENAQRNQSVTATNATKNLGLFNGTDKLRVDVRKRYSSANDPS